MRIDRVGGAANTWIVGDDAEVIVIDPGSESEAVLDRVGQREILAVICTHGHAGHVAAALDVAGRDEAPVALHPDDRLAWTEVHPGVDPEIAMEDGGIFTVADVALEVIHAPGHSPGSVVIYSEDLETVFAGDVLTLTGPVAREDGFPDFPRQLSSIGEQVLTLPAVTRVLPGHGEEFTVAVAEKRFDFWVAAGPDAAGPDAASGDFAAGSDRAAAGGVDGPSGIG
ncbi:MAG TPA: MBL fold metallo-hydrolase [Streptosporangiaceae bacterium]|nr:MBL fold metallo-hydrolase [Streptosporangiaceae bacterium]